MYFSLRRSIASNRSAEVTADENVYVQSMIAEETVCLEEIRGSRERCSARSRNHEPTTLVDCVVRSVETSNLEIDPRSRRLEKEFLKWIVVDYS